LRLAFPKVAKRKLATGPRDFPGSVSGMFAPCAEPDEKGSRTQLANGNDVAEIEAATIRIAIIDNHTYPEEYVFGC
jgi:hypothetical protein